MKVRDICAILDDLAPPKLAYTWDKIGLQTGDPGDDCERVLVALTVHTETYERALKCKAQMIVAHHPLIWKPLASLRRNDPNTALALALAEARIACYVAHTNLDLVPQGVSHRLGEVLGLEAMRPLFAAPHAAQVKLVTFVPAESLDALRSAVCGAGAGSIGEYTHCTFTSPGTGTFKPGERANPYAGSKGTLNQEPELRFEVVVPSARLEPVLQAMRKAHPYEEPAYDVVSLETPDPSAGLGIRGTLAQALPLGSFARLVCTRLGTSHVRVIGSLTAKIRNVAVIGGSGGGEMERLPSDIDVAVTGDVKYHDGISARQRGIAVLDAGHEATERPIVPALAAYLRKRCKGVRIDTYNEPTLFKVIAK